MYETVRLAISDGVPIACSPKTFTKWLSPVASSKSARMGFAHCLTKNLPEMVFVDVSVLWTHNEPESAVFQIAVSPTDDGSQMKIVMEHFPVLIVSAMIGLCQATVAGNQVRVGEEFDLRPGQEIQVENGGPIIKFLAVPEDSRCPEDVTCVWQGNAEVLLQIRRSKKKSVTVTVNTGVEPMAADYRQLKVKLVKLSPGKRSDRRLDPSTYRATLVVTRKNENN